MTSTTSEVSGKTNKNEAQWRKASAKTSRLAP